MGREPKLIVAVGKKSVGKSYTTMKLIESYVRGNPAKGVPPRRALILDVNDEYGNIKAINLSDVALFSIHPIIEVRRIRPFLPNGGRMTLDDIAQTLFACLQEFRNGLLLIEDVNKYISDTMPNDLIGAICTNRHIGVDIILHYQSIGRITSKVWQNLNILRMHKFTDTVERHKHKFEDKYEYLSIAEIMINKNYLELNKKRFFVYADVDEEKLFGDFTKEFYKEAVSEFIYKNYKHLINPLLQAKDNKGKRIYTNDTAYQKVHTRLMSFMG